MDKTYLDYAAATPLDEEALAAMMPFFSQYYQNPSAMYLSARAVKEVLDEARAVVAKVLGVQPGTIVFTGSGTESSNLAIKGIMNHFVGAEMITSAVEHEAVLAPARHYKTNVAPVLANGVVDIKALEDMIADNTVLISVMYANNEIGTIQPIKEIAALVDSIKRKRQKEGNKLPLYVHTDACQAPNYLDLHAHKLGVDLMTINSSKVYGPKGVGALYVAPHVRMESLIEGGGQEYGIRSGTENIASIVGFATALQKASDMRHKEAERLRELQHYVVKELKNNPNIEVNGHPHLRLPNNIHITVKGADNERMVFELDEEGFEVATGSACSASSDEPSHVLKAIGLSDEDARSSLRITMGRFTTKEDIEKLVSFFLR